jgi:hypothetical protein
LSAGTVADGAYRIEPMGREDVARASEIIGRYRDFELGLVDADIKAGTDIPVVFSLGGDQGLGVIAAGFSQSGAISCTAPGEVTSGVATAASGPLDHQKAQGGRYRYTWATSKSWSGTCRQLIVTLIDGTVHRANVRFK